MCSLFSQPLHKEIDITEHNCSQTGDYGPNGWTTKFVENWLDLQAYSISVQLTACDKQGTSGHDAGAALSNIFISDLGGGAECPLSTFTCDIGLGETVRALQEEQGCRSEGLQQPGRMGQQGMCDGKDSGSLAHWMWLPFWEQLARWHFCRKNLVGPEGQECESTVCPGDTESLLQSRVRFTGFGRT